MKIDSRPKPPVRKTNSTNSRTETRMIGRLEVVFFVRAIGDARLYSHPVLRANSWDGQAPAWRVRLQISRLIHAVSASSARPNMKWLFRLLLKILFRYEAFGQIALKTPGPVLLIPNHVSWLDWVFLLVLMDDDWKFVTSSVTAQTTPLHHFLMVNEDTFPIDPTSPYAAKR